MAVYFIQAGDGGPIKIGWAENVANRRRQLQVQSYLQLNVLAMLDGGKAVEKRLHDKFKQHSIRGEWFKPHGEILREIARHSLSDETSVSVNKPKKRGPPMEHDARLYLVLSASLKAELERAAKSNGETVSEYVRELIRRALEAER